MKTLHLSIIVVTILLLVPVMMNNQVKALCMPTPDWPAAPCYGDPGYQPSKEKERQDWTPYYQYKGASWMEMMKTQMIEAMKNGTLEDWVTGNQSNYDVWRYYYVNDQAPFFRSSVSGLNDEHPYFPPPLQQLTTGITAKDVACKKGLSLVIKVEDGSPACVKPKSAVVLILHGWARESADGQIIYSMKSNSIGKLTVKYNSAQSYGPSDLNARIYNGSSMYQIQPSIIEAEVSPSIIPGNSNTTVVYTITSHDAKGVYWLSLDVCGFIPIVVDLDNSKITNSELQPSTSGWRCPVSLLQYKIVGFEGIEPEYVRIEK